MSAAWKRTEFPFRAPEPIRDLIAAINEKARHAQTALFTMLVVGVYIVATALSTTDLDLLMEKSTPIAQLGIQVPVVFSFAIAPLVFVGLHVFTLIRYHLLSLDIRHFEAELEGQVRDRRDRDRCRHLLANTEFVQMTMDRMSDSGRAGVLIHALAWGLLAVVPVVVLVVVEISTLRLQNTGIYIVQLLAVVTDILLVQWFWHASDGPPRQPEAPGAAYRLGVKIASLRLEHSRAYLRQLFGALPPLHLADWFLRAFPALWANLQALGPPVRSPRGYWTTAIGRALRIVGLTYLAVLVAGYAWPPANDASTILTGRHMRDDDQPSSSTLAWNFFRQPLDLVTCPDWRWGCRYLSVEHRTLVSHVWDKSAIAELRSVQLPKQYLPSVEGLYLAHRNLAFADFRGSRLYGARFDGADLEHAEFWEAGLQGADLGAAHLHDADFYGTSLQEINLSFASLQGADLANVSLQGADLYYASLQGADLNGASLQGADLQYASMQGADLANASLQGTFFL